MSAAVRPTTLVIDHAAIAHNVRVLQQRAGTTICAVVKADGYGHGAVPVARTALAAGAEWLAVALVEEGEELRAAGITAPVLLLSECPVTGVERLVAADLTPAVYSREFADALAAVGRARGRPVQAHLKVDTGMARVGVPEADWDAMLAHVVGTDGLVITGLWTHLARADEPTDPTTGRQLDRFDGFLALAAKHGITDAIVHTANSAGTLVHSRARRDLVRTGIAMYGLDPSTEVTASAAGLRPTMSLVTEVAFVKHVAAGTPASYGHRWSAPTDGHLATLPVGYADGVPRALAGDLWVRIDGVVRQVVGTVCMDQIIVWCADVAPDVRAPAVLIAAYGDSDPRLTVAHWARVAGTITYEIATGLGSRLRTARVDT